MSLPLNALADLYNNTLVAILDKHAPLRSRIVKTRTRVPWFTDEIRELKRRHRRAERKWRSSGSEADLMAFKSLKNRTTYLMNQARREFYTELINKNSKDQRKLFSTTRQLLNLNPVGTLFPQCTNKTALANNLGSYFIKKITDIRTDLDSMLNTSDTLSTCISDSSICSSSFSEFEILDESYVKELVLKAPTKSCRLDPAPTSVVKDCLDELLPLLTAMINTSLQSGQFVDHWKEALINPILKKTGLDLLFKNFRPISNLQFVSKLVERAVADQIHSYMLNNNLFPIYQSAYRPGHSTETALLKVKNDILLNMDKQHVTLLVLLDLSAAFDTVDHRILLNRLDFDFGISGTALKWFTSYLSHRSQRVSLDGMLSDKFKLNFGVPQGSCLGPLLFLLYSSKLFKIIEHHLTQVHSYADDTQLYLSFKPGNDLTEAAAISRMENCIFEIQHWMTSDKLKLNSDKTEFLILGTRQQLEKVNIVQLRVGSSMITPATSAIRNLGSWFDAKLNMLQHINKISSSSFYYLYNIRRIRKYLTRETTESLVHAFITCRLDYCNSLLYGLPNSHINKLQRVQNAAARLVTGMPRFCHITPVLYDLHWLPVRLRIEFKIVLLTFKCLHCLGPQYLTDLLVSITPSKYNLRSRSCNSLLLEPASFKLKVTLGDRAFISAAPMLWNRLPIHIRSIDSLNKFKTALKTYLFNSYFNS